MAIICNVNEMKLLLGDRAENYTNCQIGLAYNMAVAEIEDYCGRNIADNDADLIFIAEQIAVIKLNRMGTEGLAAQSYSGVSESYISGYPVEIQQVLNRKRKIKVIG